MHPHLKARRTTSVGRLWPVYRVNVDRLFEALKRDHPEILERHAFAETQLRHDIRDQNLCGCGMRTEACRKLYGGPKQVVMMLDGFACGDTDTHLQGLFMVGIAIGD